MTRAVVHMRIHSGTVRPPVPVVPVAVIVDDLARRLLEVWLNEFLHLFAIFLDRSLFSGLYTRLVDGLLDRFGQRLGQR